MRLHRRIIGDFARFEESRPILFQSIEGYALLKKTKEANGEAILMDLSDEELRFWSDEG